MLRLLLSIVKHSPKDTENRHTIEDHKLTERCPWDDQYDLMRANAKLQRTMRRSLNKEMSRMHREEGMPDWEME